MGIEYYLVNTKNKTFYDLSKGGWSGLDLEACTVNDPEYLADNILNDVFMRYSDETDEQWNKTIDYVKSRIVPDLLKFAENTNPKDLILINDCGDDTAILRAKKYTCVGTRFSDIGSAEHSKILAFENRHFNATNPLHWYVEEDYKNYPNFNRF